jgi:hypothetical protein
MIFWTKCKARRLPGDVLESIRADVLREFGEGLTVAYAASDGGVKTDNPALCPKKIRTFLSKASRRHWVIENAPSRNAVAYGRITDAGKGSSVPAMLAAKRNRPTSKSRPPSNVIPFSRRME